MRKGFTLVELSIVLVIVGLLIGGILVAQSMVSTSQVAAQVAQLQQFDAGVMSFKAAYKYMPGDSPAFGGDGDGFIDTGPIYPQNYVAVFGCELANFWNNINPRKFVASACILAGPGIQANTTGPSTNVPLSALGKKGSFVIVSALSIVGDQVADPANAGNYYAILDSSQAKSILYSWYRFNTTSASNSALKPSDLSALDFKTDDGNPISGNVISGRIGTIPATTVGAIEPLPATTYCSTGASYNIQSTVSECTPLIRIGAQARDPQ